MDDLKEFNKKVGSDPHRSRKPRLKGEDAYGGAIGYQTTISVPTPNRTQEGLSPSVEGLVTIQDAACWAVTSEGYLACDRSADILPAGLYSIIMTNSGIVFKKTKINIDDLLHLPDSASEEVVQEIEKFWKSERKFRDAGFLWKRGILLWGPPGSGKTSTLQLMIQSIIQKNGIALSICDQCTPEVCSIALSVLRKIEPTRPLIGILEDIDAMSVTYGESNILSMLDGEHQIDNVVYIATTNYPERLDPRFINRPSRFDVIKKIGMPSPEARKIYLEIKSKHIKNNPSEISKWVKDTDGFSIAHLKELIIAVEVFEVPYESSISRLSTMMELNLSSQESLKIGFKQ